MILFHWKPITHITGSKTFGISNITLHTILNCSKTESVNPIQWMWGIPERVLIFFVATSLSTAAQPNDKNQLTIRQLLSTPIKPSALEPRATSTKLYISLYANAPFSPFQVIQTKESFPPETAVVGQVKITPDSTLNKENQISMLSGERWTARKPEKKSATQKRNANKRNNGAFRHQKN